MFLGLDMGTSGIKALLLDGDTTIATATAPLTVQRPQALWSEQDPAAWWQALEAVMDQLQREQPQALARLRGIGLSGQMHGATLLDEHDTVLRPAILWNDGRSFAECAELEVAVPDLRAITGNIAMPGFTAPKIAWVRKHEPEIFARIAKVLLPKADLWGFGGEIYVGYKDGSSGYWDEHGRRSKAHEFLTRKSPRKNIAANDFCGCGSAYAYKDCCQRLPSPERPPWAASCRNPASS